MARPLREFTEEQIQKITEYALAGCYDKTIARLTGIPETTLKERFRDLIAEKRAERKYNLLVAQNKAVEKGNPALLIFLGKNLLDQRDTKDVNFGGSVNIILERE